LLFILFFPEPPTSGLYSLSLHDALPICLSSMTCAGIGASIYKSLPMPISPWMGGIAGAVVGGLIDSFIQPARPAVASVRYFHCQDRKSTRLNSSHVKISYAVFCLKKKKN